MNFSTPLGISAVTYVLQRMLYSGVKGRNEAPPDNIGPLDDPLISITTPDKLDDTQEKDQLNLFMYMVNFNSGWSSQLQPARNSAGKRVENPPLAIDLHYLLSAYSGEQDIDREVLLGYGMQVFHDNAVLSKSFIAAELTAPTPSFLKKSNLENQVERIKITPETLTTEEISRLWAAFGAKYRPSAAYRVTLVLTQTQREIEPGPPVRSRNVYVRPFQVPVIEKIVAIDPDSDQPQPDRLIRLGDELSIHGYHLKGELVEVRIGDGSPLTPSKVTENQIIVSLPTNLKAGVQTVQVIHQLNMGTPETPHTGPVSNAGAFMLSPLLDPKPADIHVISASQNAVIAGISPPVYNGQKVFVLLEEILPAGSPSAPKSWQIRVPEDNLPTPGASANSLSVTLQGIDSGHYTIRLRVDNAESVYIP